MGWPSRLYWGRWLPASVKRAERIIAVSEHTKKDIMKYLRVPERKIVVIHSSGHEGFRRNVGSATLEGMRQRFGIEENYFLAVGTLEPRKNIGGIIEAFRLFLQAKKLDEKISADHRGVFGFCAPEIFPETEKGFSNWNSLVKFTGFVEQETLNALYGGAHALWRLSSFGITGDRRTILRPVKHQ